MLIYLDMDGVLSDLDGALCLYGGVSLSDLQEASLRQSLIRARVLQLGLGHWESLPALHPDLWHTQIRRWYALGHEIEILTSYGSWDVLSVGPQSHQGKCNWLRSHYGILFEEGILTGFNGVERCWQKQLFAKPGTFLLDDSKENVESFLAGGGLARVYMQDRHAECLAETQQILQNNRRV